MKCFKCEKDISGLRVKKKDGNLYCRTCYNKMLLEVPEPTPEIEEVADEDPYHHGW